MERVVKWFIATLKGQYTVSSGACCHLAYTNDQTRNEKMGSEKKVAFEPVGRRVKLI
jgi:hypothetical protein